MRYAITVEKRREKHGKALVIVEAEASQRAIIKTEELAECGEVQFKMSCPTTVFHYHRVVVELGSEGTDNA